MMVTAITKRADNSASPTKIEFIPNDGFVALNRGDATCLPVGTALYSDRDNRGLAAATQSGDLGSLHTLPLLSPAGESFLFRKMNYLKYLAATLCDEGADESDAEVSTRC